MISARAAAQIRKGAEWRQENRPSAPGTIAHDLEQSLALLAEQPGIGSNYTGARTGLVRRLYMGRVDYFLYDRSKSDTLEIQAFWHARRGRQRRL